MIDRLTPRTGMALVGIALAVILILYPIGFLGGGNDDAQYLAASRCWVDAHAACLPINHWWTRWPLIAPMAIEMGLFGESRATVGVVPLAYWLAGVALIAYLGRLWIDLASGLVAALLLGVLPVYATAALDPWIDSVELAWQLAALVAATIAYRRQSRWVAILAGTLAGVAFASRETSALILGAGALGWLALDHERRIVLMWAIAGFAVVLVGELGAYYFATGDPWFRQHLALAHVTVPSAELPKGFNTAQKPFFNPAYIAAWRREAGLHVAWPIDPWLNLLASPRIGWWLIGAGALVVAGWRCLGQSARPLLRWVFGLAALVSLLLVYGLAVDPKPRIFLLLGASVALVAGACTVAGWRAGRRLVPAIGIPALWLLAALTLSSLPRFASAEPRAARWIESYGGAMEIDEPTRSMLALVPGIERPAPLGREMPYRMVAAMHGCAAIAQGSSDGLLVLIDHQGGSIGTGADLCLFRYRQRPVELR